MRGPPHHLTTSLSLSSVTLWRRGQWGGARPSVSSQTPGSASSSNNHPGSYSFKALSLQSGWRDNLLGSWVYTGFSAKDRGGNSKEFQTLHSPPIINHKATLYKVGYLSIPIFKGYSTWKQHSLFNIKPRQTKPVKATSFKICTISNNITTLGKIKTYFSIWYKTCISESLL